MRSLLVPILLKDVPLRMAVVTCYHAVCLSPSPLLSLCDGSEKLSGVSASPVQAGQRWDGTHWKCTRNIQICIRTGESATISSFQHKHTHFLVWFNYLNERIKLNSLAFCCIINEAGFPRLSRSLVLVRRQQPSVSALAHTLLYYHTGCYL